MSSSRVRITLTGLSDRLGHLHRLDDEVRAGQARRPKPPPRKVVSRVTCSGLSPATRAAAARSTVWNWLPVRIRQRSVFRSTKQLSGSMRCMGQEGDLVLGLDAVFRLCQHERRHRPSLRATRPGVAASRAYSARIAGGRERRPPPPHPRLIRQQLAPFLGRPEAVGDHRHAGIHRHHLFDARNRQRLAGIETFTLPPKTGGRAITAVSMPGTCTSMPKFAVPLILAGLSRRCSGLPSSFFAPGFSCGSAGTGSLAALAASLPKLSFLPPGPGRRRFRPGRGPAPPATRWPRR